MINLDIEQMVTVSFGMYSSPRAMASFQQAANVFRTETLHVTLGTWVSGGSLFTSLHRKGTSHFQL